LLPDAALVMPRVVVAFDHVQHVARAVTLVDRTLGEDGYRRACQELDQVRAQLARPLGPPPPVQPSQALAGSAGGRFSRQAYCAAVEKAKEHILAGDIFQVVLSQRDVVETRAHPFEIYRALRRLNPSPYNFYLDLGELQLIGSSPEALVKIEGPRAILRPIAGTRRRALRDDGSYDEAEEARLAEDLLADQKERAEHVMLVDLARNDLGRVCRPASVQVDQLMSLERYSHVMHLVSTVSGELKPELSAFDVLRASFPAGTVSGAPKIRAMEIIDDLESARRGPYAGAVGYFGPAPSRKADFAITIRTLVAAGGRVALQAGAGIVADSDPDREHEETEAKVRALRRAVELAEALTHDEAGGEGNR
jgi:anthranilate synthase component 1